MIYLFFIAGIAGGDLALKWWIEKQDPKDFPRELKGSRGKIWLYHNHNAGFPFGFLEKYQQVVRLIPLSIISGLFGVLLYLLPKKGHQIQKLGLSILLGGALSNLYDRMVRHYVVDYFSIRIGSLKKVVFNLGDFAVFLGSGILAVFGMVQDIRETVGNYALAREAKKAAAGEPAATKVMPEKAMAEGIAVTRQSLRSFLKKHSR